MTMEIDDKVWLSPSPREKQKSKRTKQITSVSSPTFSLTSRLIVALRIRPLNELERKQLNVFQCVYPIDEKRILLLDPEKLKNNILRQNRKFERQFLFDAAFGPDSTHDLVHKKITAPLVDYVVSGYNATVFAYGPTGAGKTYTMVGTRQTPGLMYLLMQTLYEKISTDEFTVYISLLEIYNEVIRDLLNPSTDVLDLLEDENGSVQVPGLSRVKAPNTDKMMQILQEGNQHRTQEPTTANSSSSRSHALLQITLYRNSVQHGRLFLIDLAGSERASQTQNRGQRLKEGAAINRSLLALGNVINALSSGDRSRYVNYRDSKLTRLLKDSLGGNSKTCMIAHVSPSSTHYDDTYNTLLYADRAKNISNQLIRNRRPNSADERHTASIIKEIRKDIGVNGGDFDGIHHTVSATQLSSDVPLSSIISDKTYSIDNNQWDILNNAPRFSTNEFSPKESNLRHVRNENSGRHFVSLFNTLKVQYLTACEKLQRLRERLLKANYEFFETELAHMSKTAILAAWKHRTNVYEEKFCRIVERIQSDTTEQEKRLSELHSIRQKLERALRKGVENLKALERRMRSLMRDAHQHDLIELLVRMAYRDAESIAATSDAVLQGVRLRWQENSLLRIRKYEQIADRLINADSQKLSDKHRLTLQAEYRVVRNQLNFHLIPLRQTDALNSVISWNTQLLKFDKNGIAQKRIDSEYEKIKRDIDLRRTVMGKSNKATSYMPIIGRNKFYSLSDTESASQNEDNNASDTLSASSSTFSSDDENSRTNEASSSSDALPPLSTTTINRNTTRTRQKALYGRLPTIQAIAPSSDAVSDTPKEHAPNARVALLLPSI